MMFLFDGVFFQLGRNGIARVWRSLLEQWQDQPFAQQWLLINRAGTLPSLPGYHTLDFPAYDSYYPGQERYRLQRLCDRYGISLFVSSYYTTPISTPSLLVVHDLILEEHGALQPFMLAEKNYAMLHAQHFITVSQATAARLRCCYSHITPDRVTTIHNGVDSGFAPATEPQIRAFRQTYGVTQPYVLVVGDRSGVGGYKNVRLLFKAFAQDRALGSNITIFCCGGASHLEAELRQLLPEGSVKHHFLSDPELAAAYSGAIALVYPSLIEGFGLPILEAMACGCPVIACPYTAIPEVAGELPLYITGTDPAELARAVRAVQEPAYRQRYQIQSLAHARKFGWQSTARTYQRQLMATAQRLGLGRTKRVASLWQHLANLQVGVESRREGFAHMRIS
ncbi:MAG: glycosyltransferase family 4 protein [Oscillatoriales cyanobacterium SM2_2_1]|nr:glycosyltransferase family 4 protein [Oscillatoriales cyanobacterium SM2_2_1]